MGVETALIVGGLSLANTIGNYNAAKSDARATAREGAIAMENRKKEIQRLAAKQKVAYLQSGVELEGTAQAVIQDTYTTGIEDVEAIRGSYQQQIKNKMTQARANLLGGIAQSALSSMSAFGSLGSVGGASQGAMASGGSYMGTAGSGLSAYNLTGTAASGGNVIMSNAIYTGV